MKSLENMYFISGFTEEYPNKPPTVRFVSKMFHPNVYADGGKFKRIFKKFMNIVGNLTCSFLIRYIVFRILGICLDILQNRWSPTYDVSAILTSIQSLLDEPNPNSPANSVAAQLYQENRREYEKRVAAIVESSWLNYPPDEDDGSGPSSGSGNDNSTSSNSGQT